MRDHCQLSGDAGGFAARGLDEAQSKALIGKSVSWRVKPVKRIWQRTRRRERFGGGIRRALRRVSGGWL